MSSCYYPPSNLDMSSCCTNGVYLNTTSGITCNKNIVPNQWPICVSFVGGNSTRATCGNGAMSKSSQKAKMPFVLLMLMSMVFMVSARRGNAPNNTRSGLNSKFRPDMPGSFTNITYSYDNIRSGVRLATTNNITFEVYDSVDEYRDRCLDSKSCELALTEDGYNYMKYTGHAINSTAEHLVKRASLNMDANADSATFNTGGECDIAAMLHSTGYDHCGERQCSISTRTYKCKQQGLYVAADMDCKIRFVGTYPGWGYRDQFVETLVRVAESKVKKWRTEWMSNPRDRTYSSIKEQQGARSIYASMWEGNDYRGSVQYFAECIHADSSACSFLLDLAGSIIPGTGPLFPVARALC